MPLSLFCFLFDEVKNFLVQSFSVWNKCASKLYVEMKKKYYNRPKHKKPANIQ